MNIDCGTQRYKQITGRGTYMTIVEHKNKNMSGCYATASMNISNIINYGGGNTSVDICRMKICGLLEKTISPAIIII